MRLPSGGNYLAIVCASQCNTVSACKRLARRRLRQGESCGSNSRTVELSRVRATLTTPNTQARLVCCRISRILNRKFSISSPQLRTLFGKTCSRVSMFPNRQTHSPGAPNRSPKVGPRAKFAGEMHTQLGVAIIFARPARHAQSLWRL